MHPAEGVFDEKNYEVSKNVLAVLRSVEPTARRAHGPHQAEDLVRPHRAAGGGATQRGHALRDERSHLPTPCGGCEAALMRARTVCRITSVQRTAITVR